MRKMNSRVTKHHNHFILVNTIFFSFSSFFEDAFLGEKLRCKTDSETGKTATDRAEVQGVRVSVASVIRARGSERPAPRASAARTVS